MGKMNLLKGSWDGRVGETVGAKWKNKKTIRTYTKPSNPDTAAQQKVRGVFGDMTKFVALFADQIKYLTGLDTAGMSVRNAIIKLNKAMIDSGVFTVADLLISKGGLQKPMNAAVTKDSTSNKVSVTFDAPTATNFSDKAIAVLVAVDAVGEIVDVASALVSTGKVEGTVAFTEANAIDSYVYFLDYRGTNKVASLSVYNNISA